MHIKESTNVLRIEQLYYMLRYDLMGEGKRLWFDLVALDNEYLNKLLPGEIKDFKEQFDDETRYLIHTRIAEIEFNANHQTQAKGEYDLMLELGESKSNNDWIAIALIGKAKCEKDPGVALEMFQKVVKFCEENATSHLPSIYHWIGFTYRRMHKIGEAIEWYQKAQRAFQENPSDLALGARISNDLGYAYSLIGEWSESRESVKYGQEIRQKLYLERRQEVAQIEKELMSAKDRETLGKLRDQLNRQWAKLEWASLELGLSFSTLGEVYRYDGDLDASLNYYKQALELFENVRDFTWQAKALFSLGETYRRIARTRYWDSDEANYFDYMEKAREVIQKSLYLCEKYQIKGERDTANRRMGRVMHDLAMYEEKRKQPDFENIARDYLEQARAYFEEGLKYSWETRDVLEELNNASELAFIVDDFMCVVGPENTPKEYKEYLAKFNDALIRHQEDRYRIHQYSVFENLYKLEKAATDYQNGDFDSALNGYRDAMVGLASDPGYGRTRFKQHFPHLAEQIEKLPTEEAEKWCLELIEAWEATPVKGKDGKMLANEIRRPDLVIWCRWHLSKLAAQKGQS